MSESISILEMLPIEIINQGSRNIQKYISIISELPERERIHSLEVNDIAGHL
jgi:hypothetical protein